jgi:hypothetical protein
MRPAPPYTVGDWGVEKTYKSEKFNIFVAGT